MGTSSKIARQVVQQMKSSFKQSKEGVVGQPVYDGSWERKSFLIKEAIKEVSLHMNVSITTTSMGYINIVQDPLD